MAYLDGYRFFLATVLTMLIMCVRVTTKGPFDWIQSDRFDEIDSHFRSVSGSTCRSKSKDQLVMRADVVSQLPVYNQLLSKIWYTNRTALIHLHNMALNRAFFYSYILQKMNDSASFSRQPNWLYFYFSAAADVNANPTMLNGSALYFDNHCHFPNWYVTVPFNKTLQLFAPKAFRWDDYQDQDNYLREPTGTVVKINDAGAGTFSNYTHPGYKMNTWYQTWLPDVVGDRDSLTKFTYHIGIKRSNTAGQFSSQGYDSYAFFGPSSPGASERDGRYLPVQWTAPYFDCGGSNKWVVSAVSPVVDYMPRYSKFTHLRRQRIVALVVMDIDLNKIDFNACGLSAGNPGPSFLSGVDKCKKTTSCKHIPGYGLKRGGYKCVCKAGTKYPWSADPVFLGSDIEQATNEEYKAGYVCEQTNLGLVLPVVDNIRGLNTDGSDWLFNKTVRDKANFEKPRVKRSRLKNESLQSDISSIYERHWTYSQYVSQLHFDGGKDEHTDRPMFSDRLLQEDHRIKHRAVMDLADSLRKMRIENFKSNKCVGCKNDEYAERNNIALSVEMDYKRDLKNLRKYQQYFLAGNQSSLFHDGQALTKRATQLHERHVERFHSSKEARNSRSRRTRSVFDETSLDRMMRILHQKASVTKENCHQLPADQLWLPGDVGYGVDKQFEPEGRTALRLSHFLSMYLQNAQPEKNFGNIKGGGYLQEDHMFGEVLANVMGNFRIISAGVFFDRHTFATKNGDLELFGPWAFMKEGAYYAMDTAGLSTQYLDQEWFLRSKTRFQANFAGVKLYKIRAHVRSNPKGESSVRFVFYPLTYRAATYEQGFWTRPYFRCDGNVDSWVMTYISPFFGLDSLRTTLEFRGVTTVDVPLDLLEINQCPQPFTVANAFKNTARCDYLSTTCSPIPGYPFTRGSYMCSCRLGFEYWHADGKEWFQGSFIELEYEKKRAGLFSRFDHLYCRPSSGGRRRSSLLTTLAGVSAVFASHLISSLKVR